MMRQRSRIRWMTVLALVFAVLTGPEFASSVPQRHRSSTDKDLTRIGHRKIAHGPNIFLQKEPELGKAYSGGYEQRAIVLHDPAVSGYLERLEQVLVQNSDADLPTTVRVIDSEQVIATTLPGGYQYVSLGLLLRLKSEGEVASILARGIAHTALHSATRELTLEQFAKIGNIPLIFTGSSTPAPGNAPQATPLTLLSFKRQDELDADYFGVQYLYKAGYDPNCFVHALDSAWGDDEASQVSTARAFRPLPPLGDRISAVQKEINELLRVRAGSAVATPEFDEFRGHLRTLKPASPPKSSDGGARPTLLGKSPSQP